MGHGRVSIVRFVAFCILATSVSSIVAPIRADSRVWPATDGVFKGLVDQALTRISSRDVGSNSFSLQPAVVHGHLLGVAQRNNVAFIVAMYALRHPRHGCVGEIVIPAFYEQNHWSSGGEGVSASCLSLHSPLDARYGDASHNQHSIHVVYGRTVSGVRAVQFVNKGRVFSPIVVRNSFFIALAACTNGQVIRALDGHNHVLYVTKPQRCVQPLIG